MDTVEISNKDKIHIEVDGSENTANVNIYINIYNFSPSNLTLLKKYLMRKIGFKQLMFTSDVDLTRPDLVAELVNSTQEALDALNKNI